MKTKATAWPNSENRLDAYPKMAAFLEEAFVAREPFKAKLEKQVEDAERAMKEAEGEAEGQ